MQLARWRRWQWIIAAICCGVAVAYFYGRPTTPEHARRISIQAFEDQLLADNGPAMSHIYVFPPHDGIYLVSFLGPLSADGPKNIRQYIYAQTPFVTESGKEDTVLTYMQQKVIEHPGIHFTYVWWKAEPWRYLLLAGAFGLVIGGAWPTVLHKLVGAGYGPKEAEYDLERFAKHADQKLQPKLPTSEQVQRLQAMTEKLEKELQPTAERSADSAAAANTPAVAVLNGKPLDQLPPQEKEDKEYRGEFYPTAKGKHPKSSGFSLVELLIIIGIIGLLISILLPALNKARQASLAIACASNLRSIGQGLAMYLIENQGTYPASYLYVGHSIVDGVQMPGSPVQGYIHWSSYLYGSGKTPPKSFQCPAMTHGGLPPTDTSQDNLDPGQVVEIPGVVDQQAPRISYTLNEAICPRNKFVIGFQNAQRVYQFVKSTQIGNPSSTILGTEWIDSGIATGRDLGEQDWVMSHRPVHAFIGSDGNLDMYSLAPNTGFRRATPADLDPDPMTQTETRTRLDWVGRNHGQKNDYPDHRKTNFLYCDWHVETKSIYDTLSPFQWGDKFYSLVPSDDLIQ